MVDVTLLEDAHGSGDTVRFRLEDSQDGVTGEAVAAWMGDEGQTAGVLVDIELDVVPDVDWQQITVDPEPGPALLTTGTGTHTGRTTLRGTVVQHVADDTVLVLRISTGLAVVSVTGSPPPQPVLGREISFTVDSIALYPTD